MSTKERIVIWLIILGFLAFILMGCNMNHPEFPINATQIANLGNNWYTFKLEGKTYMMYHRSPRMSYRGVHGVTQIKE